MSFTPKIEDIFNVTRWIDNHGIKHFYVQVVFGAVYAIPFETILELLVVGPKQGGYRIERVARNQFKSTAYIPLNKGASRPNLTNPISKLLGDNCLLDGCSLA